MESSGVTEAESSSTAADTWIQVPASADCKCADGSPYTFMVREADPTKVAIVLGDGLVCFIDRQCRAIARDQMNTTSYWGPTGIFDFSNPDNPFADHTVVLIPNCTLDQLLGKKPITYPLAGEIHHLGNINATFVTQWVAEQYPDAEDAVVVGIGFGGAATAEVAETIADLLPRARTKMILDGSGETISTAYENLATTRPDIRLARMYYANDRIQARVIADLGLPPQDTKAAIIEGDARIEANGQAVSTWIEAGSYHTPLTDQALYEITQDGTKMTQWLKDFLAGVPTQDKICTICTS